MTIDYGCNQLSYSSASDVRFTRKVCLQIKSCVLPIPFVFLRTVTIACFEWNSQLSRSALNLHILFQLNTLKITKFILKTFILLNTKTTPRHLLFYLYKDLYFTPLIRIIWNHLSKRAYLFWIVNNKLEFVFTVVWRRQLPWKWTVLFNKEWNGTNKGLTVICETKRNEMKICYLRFLFCKSLA